jgi:predicted metalloprotease
MTFTSGSRLDPSRIQRRGASAGAGGMAIGGGIGGLLLLVVGAFLGVDLTGIFGGGSSGSTVSANDPAAQQQLEQKCTTGADANASTDCLVVGTVNSLDSYWSSATPALGASFSYPQIVLFDSQTSTACGTASVQTGPFYCPTDQTIYIETNFFQILSEFGGSTGPLAQEYVIAHEYGHHIQQLLGIFDVADRTGTGANSDSVKVELMADCLAGVWTHFAATAPDASGTPFLVAPTDADINDALSAAGSVGDDNIQQASGGQANPDSFTHGTSAQRIQAFTLGYQAGSVSQCDPFGVTGSGSGAN